MVRGLAPLGLFRIIMFITTTIIRIIIIIIKGSGFGSTWGASPPPCGVVCCGVVHIKSHGVCPIPFFARR